MRGSASLPVLGARARAADKTDSPSPGSSPGTSPSKHRESSVTEQSLAGISPGEKSSRRRKNDANADASSVPARVLQRRTSIHHQPVHLPSLSVTAEFLPSPTRSTVITIPSSSSTSPTVTSPTIRMKPLLAAAAKELEKEREQRASTSRTAFAEAKKGANECWRQGRRAHIIII